MKKVYLGDSVYADFDGYGIVLTTENGYGPSNKIVLEPEVLDALDLYRKSWRDELENRSAVAEAHEYDPEATDAE